MCVICFLSWAIEVNGGVSHLGRQLLSDKIVFRYMFTLVSDNCHIGRYNPKDYINCFQLFSRFEYWTPHLFWTFTGSCSSGGIDSHMFLERGQQLQESFSAFYAHCTIILGAFLQFLMMHVKFTIYLLITLKWTAQ